MTGPHDVIGEVADPLPVRWDGCDARPPLGRLEEVIAVGERPQRQGELLAGVHMAGVLAHVEVPGTVGEEKPS